MFKINPLFGLPQEVPYEKPQETPSNMWLIRADERGREIEKLRIQCVPYEIQVNPESTWATIPSIGRNNPFYHYTGSEDTISFTIDWYAKEYFKEDVIRSCKILESWTKANGYRNSPPIIILVYGDLYGSERWILTEAPYKLSLFDKEQGMLPRQAYQDITLKRVTDHNLELYEIQRPISFDYSLGY